MPDSTTAIADQALVEEFLTEASGVYALTIDYSECTCEYDGLIDTWQHEHH